MKKLLTFHLCQVLKLLFFSGRKHNYIINAYLIIVPFLSLTSPVTPQSESIKKALDNYKKNFYLWKEPETRNLNSDSVLTVLGRWAWGPCNAVDAKSNYAYIGNGATFQVLDISEPTSPHITGEYLTEGYIYDIEVRNNIAFVCIGSGLLILDVSDSSNLQEISFINIGGIAVRVAIDSSFAYITTASGYMRVVDISDLAAPLLRGVIPTLAEFPICLEAKDRYVFIGSPQVSYMQIVNATNPDSLTDSYFDSQEAGYCAFIKDTLLFIGGSWFSTYLNIFNIQNLTDPVLIGQVEIAGAEWIDGIAVAENGLTAYALCLTSSLPTFAKGVYAIDISNLTSPVIIDNFERASQVSAPGVVSVQNTLLAAYFSGVCILDITNPNNMQFDSFFPTGGFSNKIQVKDSLAFVASGLAGLWILDVSDLGKPCSISNFQTGGYTSDVIVDDSIAYIVNWAAYEDQDSTRGLWAINLSDISSPSLISHYIGIVTRSSNAIPNSINKSGNLLFITQARTATSNDILEIVDVTNPYEPTSLGIFQGNFLAHSTALSDTLVYLSTVNGGLRIVDISNPTNPLEVSNILNTASGIYYKDLKVFTCLSSFSIINVENPNYPFIISSIFTHSNASIVDLDVNGNYAYWADISIGVIDISEPNNPIQVTTYMGKDRGLGITAFDNKILFSDQTMGVWILKNDLITSVENSSTDDTPSEFELYQNYPNPFNANTRIEFSVPYRGKITIDIFDLLGRKIKTLLNEEREKGKYKIYFSSTGLPSGIYFYQLSAGYLKAVKKMIVLK